MILAWGRTFLKITPKLKKEKKKTGKFDYLLIFNFCMAKNRKTRLKDN